jgi:STE24 endopeptidase
VASWAPESPNDNPAGAVPSARHDTTEMTADQLAEAREYRRWNVRLAIVDHLVDLAFLVWATFFVARPLDEWLQQSGWFANGWTARLAAMFFVISLAQMAVAFPLSLLAGYTLEHHFHLSTLSLAGWLWRYVKQAGLALALGVALVVGLYWLIWTTGPYWWLAAAGAFFAVSVVLGQLAPVIILPLFYTIERLDSPGLLERFTRLAGEAGLSIEGVYRIALSEETVKANAMLAGLGRTRRVLLGDTLLDGFEADEIETIFAHEVGHHVFRHIGKTLILGAVVSLAGFWICDQAMQAWMATAGEPVERSLMPVSSLPLVMLVLTAFGTLLMPLQNAISRHHERQADRYALKRSARREAYVSAFSKLARLNKSDPEPPWIEVMLFYSHPPIGERIRAAKECQPTKTDDA